MWSLIGSGTGFGLVLKGWSVFFWGGVPVGSLFVARVVEGPNDGNL